MTSWYDSSAVQAVRAAEEEAMQRADRLMDRMERQWEDRLKAEREIHEARIAQLVEDIQAYEADTVRINEELGKAWRRVRTLERELDNLQEEHEAVLEVAEAAAEFVSTSRRDAERLEEAVAVWTRAAQADSRVDRP